ncbi:hypothetical protein [Capnocytophaga canimorsus]|uniref:hypothetical protein n=1 Tax=Capnocytophaga canimorsus TaxID=28188 RepID=UPI001F50577B|nr:hypothetical protein [Capnocytophaga canimorsus]
MENNASNVEIVRTNKKKLRDVEEDLENLKKLNVVVYSVTCDGHKSILGAVKKVFPKECKVFLAIRVHIQ